MTAHALIQVCGLEVASVSKPNLLLRLSWQVAALELEFVFLKTQTT